LHAEGGTPAENMEMVTRAGIAVTQMTQKTSRRVGVLREVAKLFERENEQTRGKD